MANRLLGIITVLSLLLIPATVAARGQEPVPGIAPADHAVEGRNRLALRFGAWRLTRDPIDGGAAIMVGAGPSDLFVGLQYARFLREDLAVTAGFDVLPANSGVAVGPGGVAVGRRTITALSVGFQWNPRRAAAARSAVKPYLAAGIGPMIGTGSGVRAGPGGARVGEGTYGTFGGNVRGGVDVLLSRSFSLGAGLGYHWMQAFSDPIGERDNYSGVEVEVGLGWMFGGR